MNPVTPWDATGAASPGLVYHTRLDGRYKIEVTQDGDSYSAYLRVFDHDIDDKMIMEEKVALSYGAIFGPDVADVDSWGDMVMNFVDTEYDPK